MKQKKKQNKTKKTKVQYCVLQISCKNWRTSDLSSLKKKLRKIVTEYASLTISIKLIFSKSCGGLCIHWRQTYKYNPKSPTQKENFSWIKGNDIKKSYIHRNQMVIASMSYKNLKQGVLIEKIIENYLTFQRPYHWLQYFLLYKMVYEGVSS